MGQDAAPNQRYLVMARRWLAQKEFTTFEIRAALLRAGVAADACDGLLAQLRQDGLLDEQRTAWRYILRRSARLRGPELIARELRERGVDRALAAALLARIPDEEWYRYAERVLERYYERDGERGSRHRRGSVRRGARRRPLHDPATFLRMRGFRPREIDRVLESTGA